MLKLSSNVSLLLVLLLASFAASAQEFEVPASLPATKEDCVSTEKEMIAAARWLETTAITTDKTKRERVNAWALGWLTNSAAVSVEVKESLMKPFDKNPHLMFVWMTGYARYSLENNYSKDKLQCNIAGMKAAIACYNLGGDIKKNKTLTKLVDADKEGKLEDWVKEAL